MKDFPHQPQSRLVPSMVFLLLAICCLVATSAPSMAALPDSSPGAFERQQQHTERATTLQNKKNFRGAVIELNAVLSAEPNTVMALSALANCYLQLHQPEKGLATCNRILKLDPFSGGALLMSVMAYNDLNQPDKATATDKVLKKLGYNAESYGFLCSLASRERTPRTLGLINTEITRYPALADLYLAKIELLQELGKFREAESAAQQCVRVASYRSWVWRLAKTREGDSLLARGDYARALECVNVALAGLKFNGKDRPDTAAHVVKAMLETRAKVLTAQHDYINGIKSLDLLIANHSADPNFYLNRADLQIKEKKLSAAFNDLTAAQEVAPHCVAAFEKQAQVLSDTARHQESAKAYGAVIALDPDNPAHYIAQAKQYEALGKPAFDQLALADYSKAIEADPSEVVAYEGRAALYRKLKNFKSASLDDEQAKKIDDRHLYRRRP